VTTATRVIMNQSKSDFLHNPAYDWHRRITYVGVLLSVGGYSAIATLLAWSGSAAWLWIAMTIAGIVVALWAVLWMRSWAPPASYRLRPDGLQLDFGSAGRLGTLSVGWANVIRVTPPKASRPSYRLFIALPGDAPPVRSNLQGGDGRTVYIARRERALDLPPNVWLEVGVNLSPEAKTLVGLRSHRPSPNSPA
jgi:hypothetical protein